MSSSETPPHPNPPIQLQLALSVHICIYIPISLFIDNWPRFARGPGGRGGVEEIARFLVAAKSSATAASNAWASSAPEAAVPEQSSMATTPRDNHIIYIYIYTYIYIYMAESIWHSIAHFTGGMTTEVE